MFTGANIQSHLVTANIVGHTIFENPKFYNFLWRLFANSAAYIFGSNWG